MTLDPHPPAAKIVVVVLNWNGRDDTLACLESLRAVDYPTWELLVVDNGSQDDSVKAIRKAYPEVTVIETGRNYGFSGGNNVGIEAALKGGADLILLLNNDTRVAPDVLRMFAEAAERYPEAGVFAAKIYLFSEPRRIWYAGVRWNSRVGLFEHVNQGELDSCENCGESRDTEYACGCAMLLRATAVRAVGRLDERFFLLFEEADWCFRARAAGFRCLLVPRAKVWHRVSSSFGGRRSSLYEYFLFRNRLLWAERHLGFRDRIGIWATTLGDLCPLLEIRRGVHALCRGERSPREVYWESRMLVKDWIARLRNPETRMIEKARWRAVSDYVARRFGDSPAWIRATAEASGTGHRASNGGARGGADF